MSYTLDTKSVIENIKKHKPGIALGMTDKEIYNYAVKNYDPEEWSGVKGATYATWVDEEPTYAGRKVPQFTPPDKKDDKDNVVMSPRTWAEASLMGGIGDYFDLNYAKYAASLGSADLSRAILTGKSGYQLKDEHGRVISPEEYAEDLNFAEDALAWVLGQVNPVDGALWIGTGAIGKAFQLGGKAVGIGSATVGKGSLGWLGTKYQASSLRTSVNTLRKKNNGYARWAADWIERAPSMGASIGTFSFAAGTLHSATQQRMSKKVDENGNVVNPGEAGYASATGVGEVDIGKTLWEGGKAGLEGLILGSVTAGVHSAIATPLAKQAMKYEKAGSPFKKNVANILKSPATAMIPSVGVEGAIFGNMPYLWKGVPTQEDGTTDWHQVGHDWAHAFAVVSYIKTGMAAANFLGRKMRGEVLEDYDSITSGKSKKISDKNAKEVSDNIKKDLESKGFDPVHIEEIIRTLHEKEFKDIKDVNLDEVGGKEKLVEIFDRSKELREKIEKGEKLTSEEINQVVYELWPALKIMNQIYHERISSKESFDNYLDTYIGPEFKKQNKREWDIEGGERDKVGADIKKTLEKHSKSIDKINESMNEEVYKPRKKLRTKLEKDISGEETLLKKLDKTQQKDFKDRIAERDKLLKERKFEEAAERTKEIREDLKAPTPKDKINNLKRRIRTLGQNKKIATSEINKLIKVEEKNAKGDERALIEGLRELEKEYLKGDKGIEGLPDEARTTDVDTFRDKKSKHRKKEIAEEIDSRTKALAEEQSKIEGDKPFKKGTKEDKNYESSYEVIKHMIQNLLPERFSKRGPRTKKKQVKGSKALKKTKMFLDINTTTKWVREMNNFAIWLAERGLNFNTMRNSHIKKYISENVGHRWALGTLVNEINSLGLKIKFRANSDKLAEWAGEAQPTPRKGLRVEDVDFAKEGKDNYLRVIVSKTGEYVNKYISTKLRGLYRKLKKQVGAEEYFKDKKGNILFNEQLNGFVDYVFGPKRLADKARLLRDSIAGWAKRKYGQDAKDLIMQEVLFEEAVKENVVKTYGADPISQKKAADKLVKEYIKEISNGGKSEKITSHYTTKEIAEALKKIKETKGDITFLDTNGKRVTIDKITAETLARTLIETAPRLNEVVPLKPKTTTTKKTTTTTKKIKVDPKMATMTHVDVLIKSGEYAKAKAYIEFMRGQKQKSPLKQVKWEHNLLALEKRIPKQERQTLPKGPQKGHSETPAEKIKREKLRKKYDDIVEEVKDNQKELYDEKGDPLPKEVPETVQDGVVRVRAGASVEAAIHGMGHSVYKFLYSIQKSMPNTRLGKTAAGIIRHMQKTTSMSKKSRDKVKEWTKIYMERDGMNYKDAKRRAIEETFNTMTMEYVAGRVMDKGVFKRITDWMERTYQLAKARFKSVDKLTEREAIVLYGEDFIYRKTIPRMTYKRPVGKDKMEFMTYTNDIKDLRAIAEQRIRDYIKKSKLLKSNDYHSILEQLAAGVQDLLPGEAFSLESASVKDIIVVIENLAKIDTKRSGGASDVVSLLKDIREIDRLRIKTDFGDTYQKKWLMLNDVPTGNLLDAPKRVRNEWKALLYEHRVDKSKFAEWETNLENLLETNDMKKLMGRMEEGTINSIKMSAAKGLLNFIKFTKYLGLNNLSKWNYRHITAELNHIGPFLEFMDTTAPRVLTNKVWEKIRPVFTLMEANEKGEFIRLNDPAVNKKEKSIILKFIKKAFIVETKIDNRRKKGSQEILVNKGINWNPKTGKGSTEGRLMYYFKYGVMERYVREFNQLLDLKFTKAGKEAVLKNNDIQFLNKTDVAFYLPRRYTKQFANTFDVRDMQYQKIVNERADKIAIKMATERYGEKYTKATTKEKAKMALEFKDNAIIMSKGELFTAVSFGGEHFKLGNLVTRIKHKLPETHTTKKGKKIKVWETDFEAGVMPMALGWSKLLANMEHAPWAVGLKGFKSSDKDMSRAIEELSVVAGLKGTEARDVKDFIKTGIQQRTGTESVIQYNRAGQGLMRDYTATLMRLQLGGPLPLSGIKNYFEQAKQMVHTFVFGDVINNALLAFNKQERSLTERRGGVGSVGISALKPHAEWLKKGTEKVFKTGLMPFTESVGRTWARLAGSAEFRRITDILHLGGKDHALFNKAKARLKEFYELTEYQVETLMKYGADPNLKKLKKSDALLISRELRNIERQIEMISHMKTAGSTIDANMPYWGNKKGIKPLLMYKRIAISTTGNNVEMFRYNIKHGHLMRSAMFLGGTAISGAVRLGILKMVLGQTLPDENSDFWPRFWTTMWAGEFLGILSEVFSPYGVFRSGDINQAFSLENNALFNAAVLTHAKESIDLLHTTFGHYTGAYEVKNLPSQQFNRWARATAAGYNNTYKVMSQRFNQYNRDYKDVTMWQNDFNNKHGYFSQSRGANESKKYFKALKIAFNHGNMDDLNEAAIMAFLGYASDRIALGADYNSALKEAKREVNSRIKDFNPLQNAIKRTSDKKDYLITPSEGFLLGLHDDKKKIVARSYFAYKKRLADFNAQFGYYLRKQNLQEYAKNFNFKLDKKYDRAMEKIRKKSK